VFEGPFSYFALLFVVFLSTTSLSTRRAAYLSGPVAFADAFEAITASEAAHVGVTFSNTYGAPTTPIAFSSCLGFMVLDVLLYILIALYLDQVRLHCGFA
jgi:hypothetical protein